MTFCSEATFQLISVERIVNPSKWTSMALTPNSQPSLIRASFSLNKATKDYLCTCVK